MGSVTTLADVTNRSFDPTIIDVGREQVYTPDRCYISKADLLRAKKERAPIIDAFYQNLPFCGWNADDFDEGRVRRGEQGLVVQVGNGGWRGTDLGCPGIVLVGDMLDSFLSYFNVAKASPEKLINQMVSTYMSVQSLLGIGLERK